jgi:hypothetical protein
MKPRRCKSSTNLDIFLDFPSTKTFLLVIWENIAFWRIPSFRDSYPKTHDGSYDRESPLSPYQAWILGRIGRLMLQLRRSERVKSYILKNPQDFSRYQFNKAHNQVQQQIGA